MKLTVFIFILTFSGCFGIPLPWLDTGSPVSPQSLFPDVKQNVVQNGGNINQSQQATDDLQPLSNSNLKENGVSLSVNMLQHMNGLELLKILGANLDEPIPITDVTGASQLHTFSTNINTGIQPLAQSTEHIQGLIVTGQTPSGGVLGNINAQNGQIQNGGLLGNIQVQNGQINNVATVGNEQIQNTGNSDNLQLQNSSSTVNSQAQNGQVPNYASLSNGQIHNSGILGNIQVQNGQIQGVATAGNGVLGNPPTQNGEVQNSGSLGSTSLQNGQTPNFGTIGSGQIHNEYTQNGQIHHGTAAGNNVQQQSVNGQRPLLSNGVTQTSISYGNGNFVFPNTLIAQQNNQNGQISQPYQNQNVNSYQNYGGHSLSSNQQLYSFAPTINNQFNSNSTTTNTGSQNEIAGVAQTNYNPDYFNQAQMYTNPVMMLAAGMGSKDNYGTFDSMQSFLSGSGNQAGTGSGQYGQSQFPNTEAVFNPNTLMKSLISTANKYYNPNAYNTHQNYISTNYWGMSNSDSGGPNHHMNTQGLTSQGHILNTALQGPTKPHSSASGGKYVQGFPLTQQQLTQYQTDNINPAKVNLLPNNMVMPTGKPQTTDTKFDFDPDKINLFAGNFMPGQISPAQINGIALQSIGSNISYNADTVNEHLMSMTEAQQRIQQLQQQRQQQQQQQQGIHQNKKLPMKMNHQQASDLKELNSVVLPKYNPDTFNKATMDFQPQKFMGIYTDDTTSGITNVFKQDSSEIPTFRPGNLYPGYKPIRPPILNGNQAQTRKLIGSANVGHIQSSVSIDSDIDVNRQNLFDSLKRHENVKEHNKNSSADQTSLQNISSTSLVRNISTTPVTAPITISTIQTHIKGNDTEHSKNNGSLSSISDKNPHTTTDIWGQNISPGNVNFQTMFNPEFSPGMNSAQTSGIQFGQIPQSLGSTNNNPFKFNMAGNFDPSKVNTAHMSFNLQEQMGIVGNSGTFNQDMNNFNGIYDPNKTNFLAVQNPFSQTNSTDANIGTNSFIGGTITNSGFIGTFDPNSINQESIQNVLNSNKTDANGGTDYMSMFMGAGTGGMMGSSAFSGNFNPSDVNKAVFNPNEVNNVQMNFDPSEMLEKNPGYDKDKAYSYSFNPNKINDVKLSFTPQFLDQISGNLSSKNKTDNANNAIGTSFVPGLLTGNGNTQAAIFNPNSVNNVQMNFSPVDFMNQVPGINSTGLITNMNGTQGKTITQTNGTLPTSFDPTTVNNVHMNFSPNGFDTATYDKNKQQDNSVFSPGSFPSGAVNFSPVFTKTGKLSDMNGHIFGGSQPTRNSNNKKD